METGACVFFALSSNSSQPAGTRHPPSSDTSPPKTEVSAIGGFLLFKKQRLVVLRLSLFLSPGNIWNRSAGWPGLVLPRLTDTQRMVPTSGPFHPLLLLHLLLCLLTPLWTLPALHLKDGSFNGKEEIRQWRMCGWTMCGCPACSLRADRLVCLLQRMKDTGHSSSRRSGPS